MRVSRRAASVVGSVLTACILAMGCGDSDDGTDPPVNGTVAGSVSAAGAGVSGATLTLQAAGQEERSTTSDANGSFAFTGVPAGSWTFDVTPPSGFAFASGHAATQSITVIGGQTLTLHVLLVADGGDE